MMQGKKDQKQRDLLKKKRLKTTLIRLVLMKLKNHNMQMTDVFQEELFLLMSNYLQLVGGVVNAKYGESLIVRSELS